MPLPSILLIHGAASGAWVWQSWRRHLGALRWEVNVLDLRGHGRSLPIDFATVTMEDYLWDVESVAQQITAARGAHPVIGGWSMGGMLAMMYAARHPETPALLMFEPSPPRDIAGRPQSDLVRRFAGEVLSPEHLGIYPGDAARSRDVLFDLTDSELAGFLEQSAGATESGMAFRQNLRGISIAPEEIGAPSLTLYGEVESRPAVAEQNRELARYLSGESLAVPGAGHWGIVYSEAVVQRTAPWVDAWLRRVVPA